MNFFYPNELELKVFHIKDRLLHGRNWKILLTYSMFHRRLICEVQFYIILRCSSLLHIGKALPQKSIDAANITQPNFGLHNWYTHGTD